MEFEKHIKPISFNPNRNTDVEAFKVANKMKDFAGSIKELIVEYWKNNDMPNERLELKKEIRKIETISFTRQQYAVNKSKIIQLEDLLNIPELERYKFPVAPKRIDVLKNRLINKKLSRCQLQRINNEIQQLESQDEK